MTAQDFALFDTNIGRCGIAWSARGIAGVQLPEASEAKTRARLTRRYPHAREAPPPADVCRAIDAITSLLRGEPRDLSAVALDMEGIPEFDRGVYEAARGIVAGATVSYGELAARVGERGLAREVGQALGRNSSSRAIAYWPPAARQEASPPTAELPPGSACSRSNVPARAMRRPFSMTTAHSVSPSNRRRVAAAERTAARKPAGFSLACQGCTGDPYMRAGERTAS
jgi:methylated-DNA-[protein]-cysteine S-methyltransferase